MSIEGRIKEVESNGPKEEGAEPTAETEFDEEALAFNC